MTERNGLTWRHAAGAAIIGAASVLLQPAPTVAAPQYIMKFGTATKGETQEEYLNMYKAALDKASGGRIEVQVYPNSELGAIAREIEGVQLGSIQAYMGPVDFFVGLDPRFGVFSAPTLFRDDKNADAAIHDPKLEKIILSLGEPKGLVGIATVSVGAADYAAKRPLMRLADFDGKKLRINGTALERMKMARLGATGVAMPLSEVTPALDQGVIDGTISGLSVFVAFKMVNLVKVVTVTNDTQLVSLAVVSKRWLNSLPPDLQKLVIATGRRIEPKTQAWEIKFSEQLVKDWNAMGGRVHMLPAADIAKMDKELSDVGDKVTQDQPKVHAFYREVRAIAARH